MNLFSRPEQPTRSELLALVDRMKAELAESEAENVRLRELVGKLQSELAQETAAHDALRIMRTAPPITTTHPVLPVDGPRESPGHVDPATTIMAPRRCSACGAPMAFGMVHSCVTSGQIDYRPQRTDVA